MKKVRYILMVLAAVFVLAACGKATAESSAPCGEVSNLIEKAQESLNDKRGTPAAAEAREDLTALQTRQAECQPVEESPDVPLSADELANQLATVFQGFDPGDIVVGSENVEFEGAAEERGTAAFSQRTLKTSAEVGEFLREDTPVSHAALERVTAAIREAGYGDEEVARATSGEGYFPLQVTVAAQVLGTTYFRDGKVFEMGEWRAVGANDVFWMFLSRDGKIVFGATVRADCGNPNLVRVTPPPPDNPPPPIEELCPDHPGDVPNEEGLCPKHPEEDVNVNPLVPPQVQGPGTTPVGTDPGPAVEPVDSPTGCNGPCPEPSTTTTTSASPSPTTTTTAAPDPTPVSEDPPTTGDPGPPPSD